MPRFRCLLLLIVLLSFAGLACAGPDESDAPKRPRGSADVMKISVSPAELAAAPGTPAVFQVDMDIAKTWHLYAHAYNEDPESFFIGIDLSLPEDSPFSDLAVTYPEAHEGEFMGEKVMMHEGKESLKVSLTVPDGLEAGEHTVKLNLSAQACDDKICLAPADIPIALKLTVK